MIKKYMKYRHRTDKKATYRTRLRPWEGGRQLLHSATYSDHPHGYTSLAHGPVVRHHK